MKRFIALILAMILCFVLSWAPVYSDPGDETYPGTDTTEVVWDNPNYPPPPPGYEGVWPPPDWNESMNGGESGAGDGGDESGWDDPTQ